MTEENGFTEHMAEGETFEMTLKYDTKIGKVEFEQEFTWGSAADTLRVLAGTGYPEKMVADIFTALYEAGEPSIVKAYDEFEDDEEEMTL